MPLYSSRHTFFIWMPLLILLYCSTESKVHNLWLHFEFLFNCITSRLHTALSLLQGPETVSLPSLKWTCPEVGVRAVFPGPLTIQTRPLWSRDIPSRSPGCRRSRHILAVPARLSALQHTDSAILWIQIQLCSAILWMQAWRCRCMQGGFSSDQAGSQDHRNSEAYLPKHSGPELLQLLRFCHLSYWDKSFAPLPLCQLQSFNPWLQSRYALNPLTTPSAFVHRQQHYVKDHHGAAGFRLTPETPPCP